VVWFKFGDEGLRTLEEQLQGLELALSETKGKSVLDLGCAEGLIGREFSLAGATKVFGIEIQPLSVKKAREVCEGLEIEFVAANLKGWIEEHQPKKYDIVLALGILTKLRDMALGARWAAKSTKDLLCFRAPIDKKGQGDIEREFIRAGLRLVEKFPGVRGESVEYWRRIRVEGDNNKKDRLDNSNPG